MTRSSARPAAAGEGVGGGRGDHEDLAPAGEGDVLDGGRVVPHADGHAPTGEGRERGAGHHALGVGGQQRLDLGAGLHERAGQLGG